MRDAPNAVMIFAAGFGTRMGDLTKGRPKPLIKVAGKPLIDHALDIAEGANVSRKVVNAHYHANQLAAHLEGRDVTVSIEEPEILDTGGGLRFARGKLGGNTVFSLNSDAVWTGPNPLKTLAAAWDPGKMEALLLLVPTDRASGRSGPGDFHLHDDGQLRRSGEMVFTGAQIIKTDRLDNVEDMAFSLNTVWNAMIETETLFGAIHSGKWCDVGHPDGIAVAEAMLTDV